MNFNWFKNKKFTVIAAVLSAMLAAGTLAGCSNVSKSDFDALEKRVEALEKGTDSESGNKNSFETNKSGKSTASPKTSSKPSSDNGEFDSENVSKEIDVKEYDYIDADDNKFSFFIFDNTSNFDVNAKIEIVCKDADDNVLQESEKKVPGLSKGESSFASFAVDKDTETIVRTVYYEKYKDKDTSIGDISAKAIRAQGGANITIRNSGSSEAEDIKYLTLFFSGDDLVGFDSDKVPDIEASSSETIASICYEEFDSPKVYVAIDNE